MMNEPLPRYISSIFLIIIGVCLFWGLGNYGLLNNNDGLYAEIAREMMQRHDYIAPYLNGVPYFEKPPLLYWLIAGSFKIFGMHEWSARLITSICGLLTIGVSYLSARTILSKHTAALAALIMGTSIGFAVISRIVFFEMLLTLLLACALLSYLHWHLTRQRKFLRICYVTMALAVLAKGFVTLILAGLVVIVFNINIKRPLRLWWQDFDGIGLGLFLVIMVPWHVLMINRDIHFTWFYFINEHILRFLGQRQPKDYYEGPIYYYIYRLVVYLFPWSLCLSIFCLRFRRQPGFSISTSERDYKLFLVIWFLVFFVFFSLSRAKANYYMITAIAPLVILLSHRLEHMMHHERKIISFLLQFFILLFAVLAAGIMCIKFNFISLQLNTIIQDIIHNINSVLLIGLVILGLSSIILRVCKPLQVTYQFPLLGATSALLIIMATHIAPYFETVFSGRDIIKHCHLQADHTCYFRDYERFSSFVYYLGAPVPIIDSLSNDLLYGQKYDNHHDIFFSSTIHYTKILNRCQKVIVACDKITEFQQQFTNYHIIFATAKLSILAQ